MHYYFSCNLGEGGVTGLAIILYYAFHISPAITNFLVNAVLIAIGYKFLSKRSMYLTILVLHSNIFEFNRIMASRNWNSIVNAIFGGVSVGLGIGEIILAGGTEQGQQFWRELQRNTSM